MLRRLPQFLGTPFINNATQTRLMACNNALIGSKVTGSVRRWKQQRPTLDANFAASNTLSCLLNWFYVADRPFEGNSLKKQTPMFLWIIYRMTGLYKNFLFSLFFFFSLSFFPFFLFFLFDFFFTFFFTNKGKRLQCLHLVKENYKKLLWPNTSFYETKNVD